MTSFPPRLTNVNSSVFPPSRERQLSIHRRQPPNHALGDRDPPRSGRESQNRLRATTDAPVPAMTLAPPGGMPRMGVVGGLSAG